MDPVRIVDYDPAWPAAFEDERGRIARALAGLGDGIVAIEHAGSTAVPGLAAKPIIDILVGVRDLSVGEESVRPMEALGYEYRGEAGVPGRFYFRKGNPRTHHVHMVVHGGEFWESHIAFRDLLRTRGDLVEEYGALKRKLAERYGNDRVAYTDAKTPFIQAALSHARTPIAE